MGEPGYSTEQPDKPQYHFVYRDTIPPPKPAEVKIPSDADASAKPEPVLKPIVKIVPKSRRQVKPVAIPNRLPVKTPKIIKPKIIIKAGL